MYQELVPLINKRIAEIKTPANLFLVNKTTEKKMKIFSEFAKDFQHTLVSFVQIPTLKVFSAHGNFLTAQQPNDSHYLRGLLPDIPEVQQKIFSDLFFVQLNCMDYFGRTVDSGELPWFSMQFFFKGQKEQIHLVRRLTQPIQYNENNQATAFIDILQVLNSSLALKEENLESDLDYQVLGAKKMVNKMLKEKRAFLKKTIQLPFKEMDKRVMNMVGQGFHATEIAKELHISTASVYKINRTVLQKMKKELMWEFKNTRNLVTYLKKQDLLSTIGK